MKKFIFAPIVGLLMVLGLMAPAHAAYNSKQCDVPAGTSPVSIDLSVTRVAGDDFRVDIVGHVYDGGNRNWNWRIVRNDVIVYNGSSDGDTTISRSGINFSGDNQWRWRIASANGAITCFVNVNMTS